jgi:flavin-dependent dehydrogenase
VYRTLFRVEAERPAHLQITALEHEFPYPAAAPDCHLWFFRHGLPGYSWYVPKGNGYVNIGLGAMSAQLAGSDGIQTHWQRLLAELRAQGLLAAVEPKPKGYSYFLRTPARVVQRGNAYLTGDALGLATWDLAEGIGPAVRSGLAAARAIAEGTPYRVEAIPGYTLPLIGRALKYRFVERSRRAARVMPLPTV